ncbi:MAG: glycosyltransferase [Candidatus Rokubacteria bacterium]|nr:glycosyltransferase [Candidatus Rokubacteria bacterium]
MLKFLTVFGMGGTERQAVALGRALAPSRFALHIACLRRWGHLLGEIEALGVPLAEYGIDRLYGPRTLRAQVRFASDLRRDRIQVVHTYNFYPTVFAVPVAKLIGVPAVVSIRDTGVYLSSWQRRVQRLVCRLADRIVANAEAVRQWLVTDGYDPRKIAVIRNGVDLSAFGVSRCDGRVRQELGLRAGVPVVTVLSRLKPLKGLEDFVDAAALVAQRVRHARFLIVGDGHLVKDGGVVPDLLYREALEGHARRLGLDGRITFAGFRLDIPEVLSEATVSVLPSLSEGLSNVLLESMAAGVPVVATRVGGNPEVVVDGGTGLLVPPRDPAALARAICRVLEDAELAASFGRAGQRRIAEHFSLERMVTETEQLYLNVQEGASWAGSPRRIP